MTAGTPETDPERCSFPPDHLKAQSSVLGFFFGGDPRLPVSFPLFMTVVTAYGDAHPMGFHKDCEAIYCPSEPVREIGRKLGIAERKLRLFGLPVSKKTLDLKARCKEVHRFRVETEHPCSTIGLSLPTNSCARSFGSHLWTSLR